MPPVAGNKADKKGDIHLFRPGRPPDIAPSVPSIPLGRGSPRKDEWTLFHFRGRPRTGADVDRIVKYGWGSRYRDGDCASRGARTMNRIDMTVSAVALTLALGLAAPRALAQFATDVQCAQCVGTTDIALRAITNGRLRDNAVTANKIRDGAVTAGKLSSDAVYLTSIVVSPVGPTEAYNCIELREALAGIVDNSASRPYSIYVEPGIYDCGFQPLSITSYVKVGGAGPGYTILKGAVDVSFVVMDEASELAHLTIINFGAGGIRSRGVSISDNVRLIGLSIARPAASRIIQQFSYAGRQECT